MGSCVELCIDLRGADHVHIHARTCTQTVEGKACVSACGFVKFCGHMQRKQKEIVWFGGRKLTVEGMKKKRRLRHSQTDGDTV